MTKSIASILEKAGGFFDICYTSVGRFTPGSKINDIYNLCNLVCNLVYNLMYNLMYNLCNLMWCNFS